MLGVMGGMVYLDIYVCLCCIHSWLWVRHEWYKYVLLYSFMDEGNVNGIHGCIIDIHWRGERE